MNISKDESLSHDQCKKSCNCADGVTMRQTLSELDFERGIWSAAQSGELDRVTSLLTKGTHPDAEDASGYTALHYASRNGQLAICKELIRHGAYVDATTRSGKTTSLHRAATQGHLEVVKLLLSSNARANLQDADGLTALHRALASDRIEVAKLLRKITDPGLVDHKGRTWRDVAKERGKMEFLT